MALFLDAGGAPLRRGDYVTVPALPAPDNGKVWEVMNFAERNTSFLEALQTAKDAGFEITPIYVAELAERYDVPVPQIAVEAVEGSGEPTATAPQPDETGQSDGQ